MENKQGSLLDRALATEPSKRTRGIRTEEEIALACAWIRGRVDDSQVGAALGKDRTATASWAAYTLRVAVGNGKVKLEYDSE